MTGTEAHLVQVRARGLAVSAYTYMMLAHELLVRILSCALPWPAGLETLRWPHAGVPAPGLRAPAVRDC